MKAQELRIGNVIHDVPNIRDVDVIGIESTWNKVCVRYGNRSDYKMNMDSLIPIPLTKEIRDKYNLPTSFTFSKNFTCYLWFDEGDEDIVYIEQYSEGAYPLKHIKYLHQYQNLYYELTGEELTISK